MNLAFGLAWLAAACSGGPGAAPTGTPAQTGGGAGNGAGTPAAAGPTQATRMAILSELKKSVDARTAASGDWNSASEGEQIIQGGGVRTGESSRVRIETSEGSIIRIGANTVFELAGFSPEPQDPVTKLQLDAGKVWVWVTKALGAGSFEVETPSGVATVRGSLMSVDYDPAAGRLSVTCAEGQCTLSDRLQNVVGLTEGQQADIGRAGQPPSAARRMERGQVTEWLQEFPEAQDILQRLLGRLEAEGTPTPPSGSAAGQTACDHPYLPMRLGATWTYQSPSGTMTWTITAVSGDAAQATADMTFTIGEVSGTYHWTCTPAGLVSYDFGALSSTGLGQFATFEVKGESGVWLPAAAQLTPGYSWTNSYEMNMSIDAGSGQVQALGTSTVEQSFQVLDLEAATVLSQTVPGLHVQQQHNQTTQTVVGNFTGPATTFSSTSVLTFAQGVGIVEMNGTDGLTQLVSYSVP